MRLKRVRIQGFKTFADRTELEIDGDLIAVVGPNGCGKSNIVDAILWGLGEPNARQLRAQTGQDVIFNGSAHRRPLSFAEVTLTFANEDGALAIDSAEVAITRRLGRNGDSEYLINRQTCRLKDVFDLLADSGLGRSGYAIVGQKEIDAALAASPEDRRAWIDEAAGVQRYRAKRTESLKRLDAAADHLSRIDDILGEIESQIGPLEAQAEVAKRYKAILGSLREIESGLLIAELARAVEETQRLETQAKSAVETAARESDAATALEEEARALGERISALESEIDSLRELQKGALTAAERAEGAIQLGLQKLQSLDELEQSLTDEASAAAERLAQADADVAHAEAEETSERAAAQALHEALGGAGDEAKRLRQELEAAETALQSAREAEAARLRRQAEASQREARARAIGRELAGIAETLPELKSAVDEAQAALDGHEAARSGRREAVREHEASIERIRQTEVQAAAENRRVLAEIAALEGRVRGIEATLETHEGLAQGARAVMALVEAGEIRGDYRPVVEAIDVEARLATAIETALGAAANDLIVPDEDHARRAIAVLKERRLGRATFQPIPLMRPPRGVPDAVRRERGVVGVASELVECRREHRPVVDSLLGGILITETLDDSLRLAKTSGWSRLVTLDGEVVHASGAVTGGVASRSGSGTLQRKAELTQLQEEIGRLSHRVRAAEGDTKRRQAEIARHEAEIAALRETERGSQSEREEARQWLNNLRGELQVTERTEAKLRQELAGLEGAETTEEKPIDLAAIQSECDRLIRELAAKSADADAATERLRDAETRLNRARERVREAVRRREAAREAQTHRESRLAGLDGERARAQAHIDEHRQSKETAEARAQSIHERLEAALDQRRGWLETSFRLTEEAKERRRNASASAEVAHQAELARARSDARRAGALQRLLEEYGITQEDALQQAPGLEVPEDAPTLVPKLRRELKAMGDVNLGAIEAFDRLDERRRELTIQRDDVLAGKREVETAIAQLDRLTRDRFRTTFDQLQTEFATTFSMLFGGGEGGLRLTDPDNLLGTGVEVEVTVPGKKRQRLELLSGGERALSACAFLFALLRVRPSPLVVLDEVDAPLDGRNVERFVDVLRGFLGTTQFLIITHNPVTIAAASHWFGVTMQEPGVSTVVPFTVERDGLVQSAKREALVHAVVPGEMLNPA